MKRLLLVGGLLLMILSCGEEVKEKKNEVVNDPQKKEVRTISRLEITDLYKDDSVSIRGLEIYNEQTLAYASNKGFGILKIFENDTVNFNVYNEFLKNTEVKTVSSFRSLSLVNEKLFAMTIGNPAMVFGTHINDFGNINVTYSEEHEKVFYDSIDFWNDQEGIAMGDPTEDCLSIIITRDGGNTWNKIPCVDLPKAAEGEAAFAASDSNIAIVGNHAWIISGGAKSRVFHTSDKGKTWEVVNTPLVQGEGAQGGYSMDFFDEMNGFIIGGDYTKPEANKGNKAVTKDGGKTWELVADGAEPDYRSCVQYIPNGVGNELIAVGFRGISYSNDYGKSWKKLSDESFFTLRFLNDSIAYAAGRERISRIVYR